MALLRTGDPQRKAQFAWKAKEVVRQIYDHTDHESAEAPVDEILRDFAEPEMPTRSAAWADPSPAGATKSSFGTDPT